MTARMQIKNPNAITNHQSHGFERFSGDKSDISVLRFTIIVHFANDNPNPASAPYRAATVWHKHINTKKPTQLNNNATKKKKIHKIRLV